MTSIIDSFTIYCLATGKPIAALADDETGAIIDSLGSMPLAEQAEHLERLTLMSMRPSMIWMGLTPARVEHLRAHNPRQLLAYLLNRLFHSADMDRKTGKPLNHDAWLVARRARIIMWDHIEHCGLTDSQIDSMLYVLLRIDSRYSLPKSVPPAALLALVESWHTNLVGFVQALWDWNTALHAKELADYKQAKLAAEFWSEGNRLTRKALAEQFTRVTPPTPKQLEMREKKAKRQDSLDFLDQLERELTMNPNAEPTDPVLRVNQATKPVSPSGPRVKIRLVKFGRKES